MGGGVSTELLDLIKNNIYNVLFSDNVIISKYGNDFNIVNTNHPQSISNFLDYVVQNKEKIIYWSYNDDNVSNEYEKEVIRDSINYTFNLCKKANTIEEVIYLLMQNFYINSFIGAYYYDLNNKYDWDYYLKKNDVWITHFKDVNENTTWKYGIPLDGRQDEYFFRLTYANEDSSGNIKIYCLSPMEFCLCGLMNNRDDDIITNSTVLQLHELVKSPIFEITRDIHPYNNETVRKLIEVKLV